jgi:hypothetical protein
MQQADSTDPYIDPYFVHEEIRAGDSLLYAINFQNGSGPLDITGFVFLFTAKRSKLDDDSVAVVQTRYSVPPGTIAQSGVLSFEAINNAQSSSIPPDTTYVMDLRYITPANMVATIVDGNITVKRPVGQNILAP